MPAELRAQRARLAVLLRDARIAAGFTQALVAERCGVHAAHWSKIESGQSGTTIEVLIKAAALLGIDLGDLSPLAEEDRR